MICSLSCNPDSHSPIYFLSSISHHILSSRLKATNSFRVSAARFKTDYAQPLLRPRALRIAKAQFSRAPTPAEASRNFLRNQNGVPPSSPARSKVGVQNRDLQTSHKDVSADDASHCTHRPLSIAIQFGPQLGCGALFLEWIDRFIVRRLSLQARVVPHAHSPASAWPVSCSIYVFAILFGLELSSSQTSAKAPPIP